jgi:hypothetical protein
MIYVALFFVMVLILIDRLHCLQVSTAVFRFQCRLFEVRDHLREGVIKGEVDPTHWVFQYLDSTLVKTIDTLDTLTFWRVLGIALSRTHTTSVKALQVLDVELEKPYNEYLRKVYGMYNGILFLFLLDRHPVLRTLLIGMFRLAHFGGRIQGWFKRITSITASSSETSTLADFAPA